MSDLSDLPTCRRTVLKGAALAGVAGLGLTACAAGGGGGGDTVEGPVELGAATEVPVGGATLYRDAKIVVAQPTKGSYKAFTAVCTHQGCVCERLDGTSLSCPCHGSVFDAATGAVKQGPATQPLAAVDVQLKDGKLVAGTSA